MHKIILQNREVQYEVTRKRMKGIRFYVNAQHIVQVRAPYFALKRDIEKALREHEDWILAQFSRSIISLVEDLQTTYILGKQYPIQWMSGTRNRWTILEDRVVIESTSLEKEACRAHLLAHKKALLQQYVAKFTPYCERCSGVSGVKYYYRQMTSRFGSCTPAKNHISLNAQLASLDPRAIRHVMLHEYAHFVHLNHSTDFHQVLESWDENTAWATKYLKNVRFR